MRDIDTIDAELRLVALLREAARERGGPASGRRSCSARHQQVTFAV
jgi:hypothetical protein